MNKAAAKASVLVVSDNNDWVRSWVEVFSGLEAGDCSAFNFKFVPVYGYGELEAMTLSVTDSLVIFAQQTAGANPILTRVSQLRPELLINLVLSGTVQNCDSAGVSFEVDGWFAEDESDPHTIFKQLYGQVAARAKTPFANTLQTYVSAAKDAWHTPGHSGGDSLSASPWIRDFYEFMGAEVFQADLSVSVQVLDSLLDPSSVIQEAQKLAADAFGSRHSFFVTNGTSTANKVILQYLLRPGDKVLLDRGSHKSTHHGVVLCGAMPVYLASEVNQHYGLYGPVSQRSIEAAIDANPDAKVLMLTSCTYDGLRYDLRPIIERARAKGIKVMIDEAWYAHGRFHPSLRPTALEFGADYATQSTHKMLSAFSQASMIHVNDPDFDEELFRDHLNMHSSTSPQYGMIASLDVARKQMQLEGYGLLEKALALSARLRQQLKAHTSFIPLELDDMMPESLRGQGVMLDKTKVTLSTEKVGLSAEQIQLELFDRYNIQVEKVTHNTITVLITVGTTLSKVLRLEEALKKISIEHPLKYTRETTTVNCTKLPEVSELDVLPREAFFDIGEDLPLYAASGVDINQELVGRIACDQVVPYPPGVPVLVPGQRIAIEALEFLVTTLRTLERGEVHGLRTLGSTARLRVMQK